MEWTQLLNQAIDYLEEHLTGEISGTEAASHVGLSAFHFQRAFSLMTGLTVSEYLRSRRLSLAGQDLLRGAKVLDTALKYGYETPESFSKAFQRFHGAAPSRARAPGTLLKSFPRLAVKITLEGGIAMEYRIEEKPAILIVGKIKQFTNENSKEGIPAFWSEYRSSGLMDQVPGEFGICLQPEENGSAWSYCIGAESRLSAGVPAGFAELEIPAQTWAVFPCRGAMPRAIQQLWDRIYSEWLPQSGYELLPDCDIEYYTEGDTDSPEYASEIWIPVKEKKR